MKSKAMRSGPNVRIGFIDAPDSGLAHSPASDVTADTDGANDADVLSSRCCSEDDAHESEREDCFHKERGRGSSWQLGNSIRTRPIPSARPAGTPPPPPALMNWATM